MPRRYLPVFRPCCGSFDTDRSEFQGRREYVFFLNHGAHTELRVRRLRGGTKNRLRRRGDNMTQRSRTRRTVGAASLLAAIWQIGAAPIGVAQVLTPEPNLVAPPPGTNEKAEEAPALSLTTPSQTGPLVMNPNPISFDTGYPLRKFYFGGALTG